MTSILTRHRFLAPGPERQDLAWATVHIRGPKSLLLQTGTTSSFMSKPSYTSQLQLDPGVPRRKSRQGVLSMLKALFVVGCLWAIYSVASAVYASARIQQAPHPALYQDLDVPYKPSDVVRPLLDAKQTFSIVATVWVRDSELGGEDGTSVGDAKAPSDLVEGGPVLHERAIFSDTIFRDLRLESGTKDVQTAVKLKIPTSVL